MERRDFMRLSAMGLVGVASGEIGFKAEAKKPKTDNGNYSVVVIGDTHYDKAPDAVYHEGYSDPDPVREANHRKEFVRNANMWADRTRRLLRRASGLVGEDTKMAFQLGDIIQGDCGDGLNHKLMLDDAWCYIKGAIGGVPLITVAGNHDLRGSSDAVATQAYTEYMTERMSEELNKEITKTCYSFRIGPDVFIAVDFTHPDDAEIDKLFAESTDARYTFVIIHGPVLPYQSASSGNWIIHGRDGKDDARRHFRKLMAERDAIVLCGHTHTTEFARWEGDGGRITQMTMSSVWSAPEVGEYKVIRNQVSDYGDGVKNPKKAVAALFKEYKPGIREFSMAHSCGSYKLLVSDSGVKMEYYAGDSRDTTAVFTLK